MRQYLFLAVWNALGVYGLFHLWKEDLLLMPFQNDITGICIFIVGAFALAMLYILIGRWDAAAEIRARLTQVGLLGTVIGFIIALSGVSIDSVTGAEAVQQIVPLLLVGMGTALYTTLVGIVCNVWLWTCEFIYRNG